MKKYKTHIIWALVAVVALVGGIFWGRAMAGSGARSGAGSFASSTARGAFAGRGGAAGGGLVTGQVSAVDSSSITLQLANGNSEVVFYSTSTAVTEPTIVPVSKLAAGANVVVMGTSNSDGSVTAQSIQVGNGAGDFRGAPGGQSAASSSAVQ